MINIDTFVKSKQIQFIYTIFNSEMDSWNAIGKHWLFCFFNRGFIIFVPYIAYIKYIISQKQLETSGFLLNLISELQIWNAIGKHWLFCFLCRCSNIKGLGIASIPKYYRDAIQALFYISLVPPHFTMLHVRSLCLI
jgi:hypothetical protein